MKRRPTFVPGFLFLLAMSGAAQDAVVATAHETGIGPQPVSTFSIVARDEATGRLGVAVQSHWFSVGSIVTWAEAGVGAVATQSFARAAYGPELLEDLRRGMAPAAALEKRTAADESREVRQIGVVDADGRVAAWTGASCIAGAGHETGDAFSVQANIMIDDGVVPAMAAAYRKAEGDFAERLLQALEGAQTAGGDLRGRQSAAILIVEAERQPAPWMGVVLDLRIADHPQPLEELRRLLRIHAAYDAANTGDARLERRDVPGALEAYSRAEALLPEQMELSFWRGISLLQAGQEDAGMDLLARVFAREPAWLAMPQRLVDAGHLQADAELLARIAALAPGFGLREAVRTASSARIEADVRALVGFGTRHTLSDAKNKRRGIGAAARWLGAEYERISEEFHDGRLQVELVAHKVPASRRVPGGAEVVNVVATLPGADSDRLVVLSGHYDSRAGSAMDAKGDAPGANDDASGTAAVMEAARILAGLHPRATLVFLAVAGEEQGLLGATAQAQQWTDAGKTIEAMFTLDIVGGATGSSGEREPWRLRVFSEGVPTKGRPAFGSDNDAPSRQLARYLERAGEAAVPGFDVTLVFRQDRYLRGGDHRPFNDLGWAAVRLTEPHENYDWQHQDVREADGVEYGDRPDNVDYDYVARVAGTVAAAAGELARAPASPAEVQVDTRELTPHTRLEWRRGSEPDLAGYAVLYRRTHEPVWTHRRLVGLVEEIVLEGLSKDDWLFAVEALDAAGHRSLAVYPTPRFR